MPSQPSPEPHLSGTQTLLRGLAIVQAVAAGARDLKALCQATGVTRSTVHRLASALVQQRYLKQVHGSGYELGPELIALGFQAREGRPLVAVARPHLERLALETGDTIHLVEREADDVFYLDKIAGTRGLQMRSRIGQRMPLARTGVGKALLLDTDENEWRRVFDAAGPQAPAQQAQAAWPAFQQRMREYADGGYAYDLEDNEPSIRCVAAPVRDVEGRIVAALSVTSTTAYMPMRRMGQLRPVVVAAAAAISTDMGWRAGTPPARRR